MTGARVSLQEFFIPCNCFFYIVFALAIDSHAILNAYYSHYYSDNFIIIENDMYG